MKIRDHLIPTVIGTVVAIIVSICVANIANEMVKKQNRELLDEINKNFAIRELSELEGRVEEIQSLNWSSAANTPEMEEKLREELDYILKFESTNWYLKDFKIIVEPGSIDCICEQILSQIREKVYDIM